MRVLIQRVTEASVAIDGVEKSRIARGLLLLIGFETADAEADLEAAAAKIVKLRIFDDAQDVMNLSVREVEGEILAVSQFTLHAQTKKGNRPSYIRAARPEIAEPLYKRFVALLETLMEKPVQTGTFGAAMQVSLINDGPVTIWIDTAEN
ncbi:MAG: D-tyrosyl-tRNA(Tyr) deacylase [Prevotellaceae bacterium]|jgi:D-tyrosyl-tRNA(Tyr) deacylase|nr:D-tyrosyl-tRNA(Tyr) deacylase [Prevotellaceae bacterium]